MVAAALKNMDVDALLTLRADVERALGERARELERQLARVGGAPGNAARFHLPVSRIGLTRDSSDGSRTGVKGRDFLNWIEAHIRGTAGSRHSRRPEWRSRV